MIPRPQRVLPTLWEYLTWGPFYWVRRAICRLRGHAWDVDTSTPENIYFCTRCMKEEN